MPRPKPLRNPAVIGLGVVLVASILAVQGLARIVADGYDALSSSQGTTAEEMNALNVQWMTLDAMNQAINALGVLAATSALALVFVWCFWPRGGRGPAGRAGQSSEGTRTMSAAGSTVNLAETTVPNSSPSISNSSAPSTISISTERPRE